MNVIFHHFSRRLTMRRFSKRIRRSLKTTGQRVPKMSFTRDYTLYKINYKNDKMTLETESSYKRNEFGYQRPKITLATWSEDPLYTDNEEY